jgi:hypothetical protein
MHISSQWALTLALALTNASAAPRYRIDFDLQRGGTSISNPTIVVDEGREAEIIVEPADDRNSDVRIVATARAEPRARARNGVAPIRLQMAVYEKHEGAWAALSEPRVVVVPERRAQLTIAPAQPNSNAPGLVLGIVVHSVSAAGEDPDS